MALIALGDVWERHTIKYYFGDVVELVYTFVLRTNDLCHAGSTPVVLTILKQ